MENDMLIVGENQYYNMNSHETGLNNNVLVVGASGAGKTRSIVIPNLLQASGSYVVSDPKGNLYQTYGAYLREQGYVVKRLDFTRPKRSVGYNLFRYIHDDQDIRKVAHMLIYTNKKGNHADPFWDEASQLLLEAIIAYLMEAWGREEQNLHQVLELIEMCYQEGDFDSGEIAVDLLFKEHKKHHADSQAVHLYNRFRVAANNTLRSILISVNAKLGSYDNPQLARMMENDEIDIASIGRRKTAIFVVVSDTDRSLDGLVNVFFSQVICELCRYADLECKGYTLPVPVRLILDDFATNCKIEEFPRMIASFRSRGVSTMLMIQAESQLKDSYEEDGRTIIGNCDTYVYLGGNDVETAEAVAKRCDMPVMKVLNMPVGTNWIFRRGQAAVNGKNLDLEAFLAKKYIKKENQLGR